MRKIICIGSIFVVTFIVIGFVSFYVHRIPIDQVKVSVTDVEVSPFDRKYLEAENVFGYKLPDNIQENMDKYTVITIKYTINNNSPTITMRDVRFHPQFTNELKSKLTTYNSGNGTYYIFIEPKMKSGLTQYIFVEHGNMSQDEVYNKFMKEKIDITFYTKGLISVLTSNTGHGLSGLGKYTYRYVVEDCLSKTSMQK